MTAGTTPRQGGGLQGLARGGSLAVVGTGAGSVLGFVLTLVVTHGLTTTTAGEFFSTTAVFTVLQVVFSFGVGAGLVRFVPRLRALDRAHDVPALLVVAALPVTVVGVVGSVGLWFAAPLLAPRVGGGSGEETLQGLRVLALLFLPGTLEVAAVECTRAFGSIRSYVVVQQLTVPFLRPVLVGIAVLAGAPLWVVVGAWMVPLVLALVLSVLRVRACLRDEFGAPWVWPERTRSLRALAAEYWSFTAVRGLAGVMDILLTWLDVILVAALASPAQAAVYAAASRFITSGTLVLQALRLAVASDVSASLARRDHDRVSELYRTASQWVVVSSWPLYLLMAVFAAPVLSIFGRDYSQGATAMTILCLAMLVQLAAGNVGTVLLMGGKSRWVLADKAGALAVNVAANLALVPWLGITGAAIAWAATIVLDSSLAFVQVRWGMGIGGSLAGLARAAVLSVACFGVVALVVRLVAGDGLGALAGCLVVSVVLYLPLLWWQRSALGLDDFVAALTRRGAGRSSGSARA